MGLDIEDLHEYLVQHKDEIYYVALTWTWAPTYIDVETDREVDAPGSRYDGYPIYAVFSCDEIDGEYSFYGTIDDAIEYASKYDQWDGQDCFELDGCVLHANYVAENVQSEWHDDEDDIHDADKINIDFVSFAHVGPDGRVSRYYHGPMRKRRVLEINPDDYPNDCGFMDLAEEVFAQNGERLETKW